MILGLRASLSPRLALFGRRGPCSRACSTGVSTDMEIGTNGQRDIYQRLVLFVDLDRSRGPSLFLLPDGGHSPSQYALDLMDLAPALPAPPLFVYFFRWRCGAPFLLD